VISRGNRKCIKPAEIILKVANDSLSAHMYRLSVRRITHARTHASTHTDTQTHTHTHTDSEWQWHQLSHMQVCTSLQIDNHASTSLLSFLQARCPSCHPTNSFQLHASCHLTAVSSGHAAGCQPAAALCRLKL